MGVFDDFMEDNLAPLGDNWSAFGMGGPGKPGALGDWDVVGKGLDRANSMQSTKPNDDAAKAEDYLGGATGAFDNINAPNFGSITLQGPAAAPDAVASTVGPSAMGDVKVDPQARQAQMAQIAALRDLAANGGKNAASEANLAEIQSNENQNARGQRDAALQSMARRGMGSSGASLLASLDSGQHAVDRQSAEDMNVAGQEANTALNAGMGAANLGSNLEAQDFGEKAARAQAQDAVDKFNAQNTTGVSEFNTAKNQGVNNATSQAKNQGAVLNGFEVPQTSFQDQTGLAAAKAGGAKTGLDYWGDKYKEDTAAAGAQQGAILGAGGGILSAFMKKGASTGGKIPGHAVVAGDSPLNDFVPIPTSPGEVVVPRSLVAKGTKSEIGDFVQHAPIVASHTRGDKDVKLAGLRHLRRRGRTA